jgi:hypothetical protein
MLIDIYIHDALHHSFQLVITILVIHSNWSLPFWSLTFIKVSGVMLSMTPLCTMPLSITDGALNWQRLAVVNKHERDDRIQFEEETHTYTIDGTRAGWTSCTGFLHHFFSEFNADAIIKKMMASRKWSESKYYGMTAAAIKFQWSEKARIASEAGTRMHLDIEHFYNALPARWTDVEARTVDVSDGLSVMCDTDNWTPNTSPEWDYFCEFQRKHGGAFEPFRTEWLVFDEEHKVAGSIDMVYKKRDGTLAIYDWKRTEELKIENSFQNGLGPVAHLPDTNYWHYSLQLNIYRYILQKHYGYIVSELALVILHPINKTWRVAKLNMMDEEVADMMAARARALADTGNKHVILFDH